MRRTTRPEYSRDVEVARPLLGSEMLEDDEEPAVVYTPTATSLRGDEVTLVLRELEDDTTAMLAFTSLELLVRGCGETQPWLGIRPEAVEAFKELAGADKVVWDAVIATGVRQNGDYDVGGT